MERVGDVGSRGEGSERAYLCNMLREGTVRSGVQSGGLEAQLARKETMAFEI